MNGNGNHVPESLAVASSRAERRRRDREAKDQPPVVVVGGTILIRVLPNESQMSTWSVDPHAVPFILRGLADSYEKQHAANPEFEAEHAEHPHEEEPAAATPPMGS